MSTGLGLVLPLCKLELFIMALTQIRYCGHHHGRPRRAMAVLLAERVQWPSHGDPLSLHRGILCS